MIIPRQAAWRAGVAWIMAVIAPSPERRRRQRAAGHAGRKIRRAGGSVAEILPVLWRGWSRRRQNQRGESKGGGANQPLRSHDPPSLSVLNIARRQRAP